MNSPRHPSWLLLLPCLSACSDDGRKSGAEGVADAYGQLAEFQCECAAEQFGGGNDLVQACKDMLTDYDDADLDVFDCVEDIVDRDPQAKAVFDCYVDATYDYADCVRAEGCPATLTCDGGSVTYSDFDVCDGFDDCQDGSDEQGCATEPFDCGDGTQVGATDVCDGFSDCPDGEDEAADCPETCESRFDGAEERCGTIPESIEVQTEACFPGFYCEDGSGIDETSVCDGVDDCDDGSDEAVCAGATRGDRSLRGVLLRQTGHAPMSRVRPRRPT